MINLDFTDICYAQLKKYIAENCDYNVRVVRKALKQTDKFPVVVFTEEDNRLSSATLKYKMQEYVDSLYWEVNIFSTDLKVGKNTISNLEVCREISGLVDKVLRDKYKLERISCQPTPNIDDTIYRITMRYRADIYVNRRRII